MGISMKSLELRGKVETVGFSAFVSRVMMRLAEASSSPASELDTAIIRKHEDVADAAFHGFKNLACVGYSGEGLEGFNTTVRFSSELDWLGSGDVIAVEPNAGIYRVLWRNASRHNAFLVTDRCDHYCLMCSQPPKDVQDGWIIDEIQQCLEIIEPNTASLTFTGGEPFLDWRRFIPLVKMAQVRLPEASIHTFNSSRKRFMIAFSETKSGRMHFSANSCPVSGCKK